MPSASASATTVTQSIQTGTVPDERRQAVRAPGHPGAESGGLVDAQRILDSLGDSEPEKVVRWRNADRESLAPLPDGDFGFGRVASLRAAVREQFRKMHGNDGFIGDRIGPRTEIGSLISE